MSSNRWSEGLPELGERLFGPGPLALGHFKQGREKRVVNPLQLKLVGATA